MSAPETPPAPRRTGSHVLTALVFGIGGPAMTGFVVGLLAVLLSDKPSDNFAYGLFVGVFGIFYSFVYCAIPAAVIALAAAMGSRFIRDNRVWLAACAVGGSVISAGFILLTRYDGAGLLGLDAVTLFAVCGAVASLACAALTQPFRPRVIA